MGLIRKIIDWFDWSQKKCLICEKEIDTNGDEPYSIIQYQYLNGESTVFVCGDCSENIEDSSFDLHSPLDIL